MHGGSCYISGVHVDSASSTPPPSQSIYGEKSDTLIEENKDQHVPEQHQNDSESENGEHNLIEGNQPLEGL
jgi:hypothetical protein